MAGLATAYLNHSIAGLVILCKSGVLCQGGNELKAWKYYTCGCSAAVRGESRRRNGDDTLLNQDSWVALSRGGGILNLLNHC